LEQELLALQQEQQPLLLQVQQAGHHYKAALYAQRDTHQETLHQIDQAKEDLSKQVQRILDDIGNHDKQSTRHEAEAQKYRQQIQQVKEARSTLEESGTIEPEEAAEKAQQRWRQAIAQHQEHQQQAQRAWKAAEAQKHTIQKALHET